MAGAFDILDLAKKKVSNFFDPGEEVRVRDVVRELPGAIKKTAVDVGRGIIRDVTSVGSTFISPITGQEEIAIDPSLKKIFGDEPIETLQKRIANAELTLKDIGSKFNVDLDKAALPMAALLVGGITGADFIPMGAGAKAGLKPLIKSTAKTNLRTVTRLGKELIERDVDDVITELAITKNPFRKQHLQKALENKYNLKELREGIKQIAQEPFDQPKISFGTKAELIARQFAVPAEGGLTKLGNAGNILYKRSQSVADIGERRTGEFLSGYFPIRRGINKLEKERVLFDALERRAIPQTRAGMKTANYLKG